MATQFTPEDVARWMLEELTAEKYLAQYYAVAEIAARFGSYFVYPNDSGNPAPVRTSGLRTAPSRWLAAIA